MARRKKSLLAVLLSPPKRRAPRRSVALLKLPRSVLSAAAKPAKPRPVRNKPATLRKPTAARRPAAATTPGGLGTWTLVRYTGPAGSRSYYVYVPKGLPRTTRVALMVMLHGCGQTPAEFAAATRFNQLADRHGFVVVYPQQTIANNLQRCWNWFETRHQLRLAGEPAILAGIAEQVIGQTARWRIDPTRVYVAGLSAGATMALTLGATYPDVFAAIGVHSGPPYRSAQGGSHALSAMSGHASMPPVPGGGLAIPPTIVFQGTSDFTVRPVNNSRVTDQWLAYRKNATTGPTDPRRITRNSVSPNGSGRRISSVTRWYNARGRTCLESWLVTGLGHAWSGGLAKGSFSDPLGPRASTVMWRFLAAQRLTG